MQQGITSQATEKFYPQLSRTIQQLTTNFDSIPAERRAILKEMADYVATNRGNPKTELIFICTHNSRRSHISQIWAHVAAAYYGIQNVLSYSGGTEATAFNPRAVQAIERVGFKVNKTTSNENPVYEVSFSEDAAPIRVFSKKFDSEPNPVKGFAAVMTCSHADENCPLIPGVDKRISLPYNDPKDFDGTSQEAEKYLERVNEIGKEILYAFSIIK